MHRKIYTVRRLLLTEVGEIEKYFSQFDFLHFNPYKKDFLESVMLYGRIWGVYDNKKLISCGCFYPGDMDLFACSGARWNIKDLLDVKDIEYLVMGYIRTDREYSDEKVLSLFAHLATDIARRSGFKKVLHCSTAHIHTDMGQLFSAGYCLAGLRGLDKLVPHYIFTAATEEENNPCYKDKETQKCPAANTKEISRLCEQGYHGVSIDGEGNITFIYGR